MPVGRVGGEGRGGGARDRQRERERKKEKKRGREREKNTPYAVCGVELFCASILLQHLVGWWVCL